MTTQGKPRKRAVMRCGNCGEQGFRREGCGKTHNVRPGAPEIERTTIPRTAIASIPSAPIATGGAGAARRQEILERAKARTNGAPHS